MTTDGQAESVKVAAQLIRIARKSALGTRDSASGEPYVSLVGCAMGSDGQPLMLLSDLARHTQNLQRHAAASLLLEAAGDGHDPLALARVTLMGAVRPVASEAVAGARARYLATHPGAAGYAGFADFRFWMLQVTAAHFIGGFGRILELPVAALLSENAHGAAG
jgi:heme iron utilization protein